jgi:conjugative transfer relaxase protein TraI
MLSTSVIKSVSDASHYYSASDNYYTREEGMEQSEWHGKAAGKLGLSGEVNPEQFTALLEGRLPNGELLGKVVDGKVVHRAGWDLTFSAPKSVSILALIGGDKRLIDAHRTAVKVALSHIEQGCSQARIKTQDGIKCQNTRNIVAALYHHDLSRAQDPQMHTHSVVMNMTERVDGKWRSQASQIGRYDGKVTSEINGFIERTRNNKRYFGKLYEGELAYQVKELGYDIAVNSKTGVFEVVGVSDEARTFFSKRRNQVEIALQEKGLSSAKAADIATLKTRESKKNVDRESLTSEWIEQAKNLGLNCKIIIDKALNKNQQDLTDSSNVERLDVRAVDAIRQATDSLSRFKTSFSLEEVVTSSLGYSLYEPLPINSLLNSLDDACKSGDLITLENDDGKTVVMAKKTLDDEKRLFTQLENKKANSHFINNTKLEQYFAKNIHISLDNQEYLKTIFNDDRVVLLEGKLAKETLLEPIVKIAKAAQLEIAVLSPNQIGSKHFANQITQKPITFFEHFKSLFVDNTIKNYGAMQFLSQFGADKSIKPKIPDIIIVDNAHLLSTHQKADIVEWNTANETKLILLGDKKTLLPQQTGGSIQQIITHGITTISLVDNKSNGLSDSEIIKNTIQKLSNNVIDVFNSDDRLQAMAVHYSKMNAQNRQQSWLTAHKKKSIESLNNLVHLELKNKGQLGKSLTTHVLIPVFIPEGKASHADSYLKHQIVRFNDNYKSLSISRGDYLRVLDHNKDKNSVILEKADGKHVLWHPDKVAGTKSGNIELFCEKKREISIGETIAFQRSIKHINVVKGERLTITDIHNQLVKVKNKAGKSVYIDLNKQYYRHFDYGYATTLHAIAHEKPHTLIAELPTQSFSTHQRQFYQVGSQPNNAWIYTDDIKAFANHIEKRTGDKLSAHDVIIKSDDAKKNIRNLYEIIEKQIIGCAEKKNYPSLTRPAVEAIDYAIHHLAERDAGFTHKQIIETAMKHALGTVRTEDLNRAVVAVEKAGILLRGTRDDGTLWTTVDAIKIERDIIALCQKDKGTLEPIASDALLEKHCDPTKLKPEQIAAIKAITQSRDRIIAIQGYAGTGKTTMLATVADVLASNEILKSEGYEILGLAPTNKAVSELKKRGLPAQTLDSFILECQRNKERGVLIDRKLMLVIDEASMLSNRKALEALIITHEMNSRVVPVGDVRQLPAVESGKPFDLIQKQVDTKQLVDIQRQHDATLKQAVKETIDYDFKAAFQTLKNSIIEVNDKEHPAGKKIDNNNWKASLDETRKKRLDTLVADYFTFPKEEQGNIQIITPGHDDRMMVNEKIREQFKINGQLQEIGDQSCQILSAEGFTQVERSRVTNFAVGNVLRFGKSEAVGIKAGEYLTIVNTEHNHSLLTLKNSEGRQLVWQVPRFDKNRLSRVEVFKAETRALQAGDMIRWSRSDKKMELFSTEPAQVVLVEKDKVTVTLANQKLFVFDPRDPKYQHWDHGYAATVYAVQADTKSIVLAHLESHRKNLTSQPTFLVALTRAVNVFRLYTDDAAAVLRTIQQNPGVKLSSLEVIGEYPIVESHARPAKTAFDEKQVQSVFSKIVNPSDNTKPTINVNTVPRFSRDTVSRIKEGLNQSVEQIATEFLGTPIERGGHYIKFGSNQGSLSVTVKGDKQGWFNDFETNKGGRDMLKFIQVYGGMDRQQSVQYAARWLGIIPDNDSNGSSKTKAIIQKSNAKLVNENRDPSFSDYEKRRIKFANQLARESQPIKGSLAEKYLKEHRGIDTRSLPDDIRFHPGIYAKQNQKSLPALISIARTQEGKIQSVEAIFLDFKTADKADVPLKKQTIGSKKGLVVKINQVQDKDAPTLIAEGVVTGLSLANALPKTNVIVVLGKQMFSSVSPAALSEKVIFCLDNDGKNLKTDTTILASANRLKESQKVVSFMVPNDLKILKQDYNDILKQKGKEAIQMGFMRAISYDEFYKNNLLSGANNPPFPDQKTIENTLKNESHVPSKLTHHISQSSQISEKQIAKFSNEISKNNTQKMKDLMASLQKIQQGDSRSISDPFISKPVDLEREI